MESYQTVVDNGLNHNPTLIILPLSPDEVVINLTQAQVRTLVGISEEQFRSWRNAILPLKGRSGQSPQFHMGDVLAMMIIADLVDSYGAKISKLTEISTQLFELCAQFVQRQGSHPTFLIITPKSVTAATTDALPAVNEPSFVIPLDRFRTRMEKALMSAHGDDGQLSLSGI
jgi:hypothetical protein